MRRSSPVSTSVCDGRKPATSRFLCDTRTLSHAHRSDPAHVDGRARLYAVSTFTSALTISVIARLATYMTTCVALPVPAPEFWLTASGILCPGLSYQELR